MKQQRAFQKNSNVLLELLTKAQGNTPLTPDGAVLAVVDYRGVNGITRVASVTLNTCEKGCHRANLTIESGWLTGLYEVTYRFAYNGQTYEKKDDFEVIETSFDLFAQDIVDNTTEEEDSIEDTFSLSFYDFAPGPESQISANRTVQDNRVEVGPVGGWDVNHTYTLVLTEDIKATDGSSINKEDRIEFTTEYQPLYATPLEVKAVIKGLIKHLDIRDIYIALRNAGRRAHQMLGEVADGTNSRFTMFVERDDEYFPITQYVAYKASRDLLNDLLLNLLNQESGGGGTIKTSEGGFTLGDFTYSGGGESQSSSDSSTPQEIVIVNRLLKTVEEQIIFWQDAMMGRNARGYAKPVSAVSRESAGSPESRDI